MAKKKSDSMDAEIKIRIHADDKAAFERAAEEKRLTVGAWLRMAGVEKLERDKKSGGR